MSTTTYKARWHLSHRWDVNSAGDLVKIDEILNTEKYHKNFIHHTVSSGNHQTDIGFIFQCDSDPKHIASAVKTYMDRRNSQWKSMMDWPPRNSTLLESS